MKRRTALQSLIAVPLAAQTSEPRRKTRPIQLHTDLQVKPDQEKQLLDDFYKLYLPNVKKAPGFIDAKLLKFRNANIGTAPERYNYRLVQIFESEELRIKWTEAEGHKVGWHTAIEKHVTVPFIAYLYEIAAESKHT
jgi:heme-degrading monooxygenase HmoA